MQVRLRHVIDFLNQMGWLIQDSPVFLAEQGKLSIWQIHKEGEPEDPTPALISVRPLLDLREPDLRYRYAASIAFENLVFGTIPMGPENEETEAQTTEMTDNWLKMTIDEHGDLHVPNVGTVSAAEFYWNCLRGERQQGPGIPSPWVHFRQP